MRNRFLTLGLCSVLGMALVLGGCSRGQPRDQRPLVIIPDMEVQPKLKAQSETSLFADGRSMRVPPEGTVARGGLRTDPVYYEGMTNLVDSVRVARSPVPLTRDLLARGQDRFGVFCSPCHGKTGEGKGVVAGYEGMVPPTSLHDPRILGETDGHLFTVISNGIRNMKGYRAQISTEDRWAIVAFVRALQRSRNATLADVPAQIRRELSQMEE